MIGTMHPWRTRLVAGASATIFAVFLIVVPFASRDSEAGELRPILSRRGNKADCGPSFEGQQFSGEPGGTWYWMRSPEEEQRVVMGLYNRYCIRCHGVDGRGVWDIPDVPDFSNGRWQSSRSDGQIVRATLEGRGCCMPPFRGTLTLEEAWGMARYLRTFIPGTEMPRPDRVPVLPDVKKDPGVEK